MTTKTSKLTPESFWPLVANWLEELSQKPVKEHKATLRQWFTDWLQSDAASDLDYRQDVTYLAILLFGILDVFEEFTPQDIEKQLEKFIETAHVPEFITTP